MIGMTLAVGAAAIIDRGSQETHHPKPKPDQAAPVRTLPIKAPEPTPLPTLVIYLVDSGAEADTLAQTLAPHEFAYGQEEGDFLNLMAQELMFVNRDYRIVDLRDGLR